ncbi:MAG: SGNH/GDSL hydrolase family protein [Verrucomicrobiales bacterium]|jgi:lysophospholipase L1-like esterase|nr:SGNH/GDSL hydrolase family protein [Verrucomicrobiales bacterium]
MKRTLTLLLSLFAISSLASAQTQPLLQANDLAVICGDSITQQKIYSVFIEDYFLMCQPAAGLQTVQLGVGGETAAKFQLRQKNDALPFKPTVATIFYGMNDGGYVATDANRQKAYRDALTEIVKTFKANGVRLVVVGSPGVVDTDSFKRNDAAVYNQTLAGLGDIGKEIAAGNGAVFADVHSVMTDAMAKAKAKYGSKYVVAGGDGIHPDANGHLIIAYAFLKALGCDGDIGHITVDLKNNKVEADSAQKVSIANGEVQVESTRYPFCFRGDPAKPDSTLGMLEFIPFNQDLNRYMLTVKNAGTGNLKITWGANSKIFPAAELEKGINLAAEFPDNPFSAPFAKVENTIKEQQAFETASMQKMFGPIGEWSGDFPSQKTTFDQFKQTIYDINSGLRKKSTESVAPVKHSIKIEAAG